MEELGRKFKEQREKLGIELSTARDETNIRLDYLRAIEEGNFDRIEEEVYLKGFLKVYSNYLDLETQEIMEEYKQFKAQEVAEANPEQEEETDVKFSLQSFVDKHQNLMLGLVIGGLILILVAGGIYLGTVAYKQFTKHNAGQKIKEYVGELAGENNNGEQESSSQAGEQDNGVENNQSQQQETTTEANKDAEQSQSAEEQNNSQQSKPAEKSPEETSSQQKETNSQTVESEQTDSTTQPSNEQSNNQNKESVEQQAGEVPAGQLTIEIRNIEESWYLVEIDDKTAFRGILEKGATKKFSGQRIRVKIGNAAGVQIVKGDQILGPFGKKGEVVTKVFTSQTNSQQE